MSGSKKAEVEYFELIANTDDGVWHSSGKPFTDVNRANIMMSMSQVFFNLPQSPCRLLDLGCGAGWTTNWYALSGYDAVGVDIAPAAVELAKKKFGDSSAQFFVSDYESLPYENEFDCAVFYDTLHHSNNVPAAIGKVYSALKDGGKLILSEPGKGHHDSKNAIMMREKFGVTENDLPPSLLVPILKKAGFSEVHVSSTMERLIVGKLAPKERWKQIVLTILGSRIVESLLLAGRVASKFDSGFVVAIK
jgi:SAM-dependent methyltransferase